MRKVTKAEAEAQVFPPQDPDTPSAAKNVRAELKRQVEREKQKPHPSATFRFNETGDNENRPEWPDPDEENSRG